MSAKPIPEGYSTATPYLCIQGAVAALDFYKRAFGAKEIFRLEMPDGRLGHGEIEIGNSRIMLADEFPEMNFRSPKAFGGSSVQILLYVEDVDAFAAKAVAAGLKTTRKIADQFYGDRSGCFEDPFGHTWTIATHREDVSLEEMKRRMANLKPGDDCA